MNYSYNTLQLDNNVICEIYRHDKCVQRKSFKWNDVNLFYGFFKSEGCFKLIKEQFRLAHEHGSNMCELLKEQEYAKVFKENQ